MRINIKKVFNTIYLLTLTSAVLLLHSCGLGSLMFHATNINLTKEELANRLDSVRIVNVVDLRSTADFSIIGQYPSGINNKIVPVKIDRPLNEYLMESFNTLIVKDFEQTSYIPVTVFVKEFETSEIVDYGGYLNYHRYSYTFQYPGKSNKSESVLITDALTFDGSSLKQKIQKVTKDGIRSAASEFIQKFKNPNYNQKNHRDTLNYQTAINNNYKDNILFDNINSNRNQIINSKSGAYFAYFSGNKIDPGGRILYLNMSNYDNSKFEFGYGAGITFFNVKMNEDNRAAVFFALHAPFIIRYNFNEVSSGFFANCCLTLDAGSERHSYFDNREVNFFFGPTIEESLGVYLSKNFSLTLGSYQLAFLNSKLLPNDIGFVLSLSITGDY